MSYIYCTHAFMYTCYAGDVFAVIVEPGNHEGVSYYLLRCTAERTKL